MNLIANLSEFNKLNSIATLSKFNKMGEYK